MSQVIQLSKSQFESLLERINRLEKMVASLMYKKKEPPYGSDEWWEWSDKEALKDIKKGDYFELKDKEAIMDFFEHSSDQKYVYDKFHHQSKETKNKLEKSIQTKFLKQILLLVDNINHPSLHTKKMSGSENFEARIDYHYRFTFFIEEKTIIILSIGTHDQGLGKK